MQSLARWRKGRGLPLETVLLPGMMCDARLFGPQAVIGGVRIPAIPVLDNMPAMAAELLRDLPARFALGGLSMGGIIAMEVLRQAPERVAGLALLDTNPLAEAGTVKAMRAIHMEKVANGGLSDVMRDDLKPNYLVPGPDRQAILELCMEMALGLGPEVFRAQSLALRDRADQTETLRSFRGPALVLCGAQDQLCPVARHELMHGLMPQSDLVVIEGAGHLPTLECPRDTNAALANWLKEIPDG